MDNTDTKPTEAGTTQPVENTGTETLKPTEAIHVPTVQAIQGTRDETHNATTDTLTQKFDLEKFWKEFPELLNKIDREENQDTVKESLTPELVAILIPALEAGVDLKDLKYFTLKFFRINGLGMIEVLTTINKIAINMCLQNAQKVGIIDIARNPLSAYDHFTAKLLDADARRCWAMNGRYHFGPPGEVLEEELGIAMMRMDLDEMVITQIAQIVFPDYASVIPELVRKNHHWWHTFQEIHRENVTGKKE